MSAAPDPQVFDPQEFGSVGGVSACPACVAAPAAERVIPVSFTPLETRVFEDRVAVQGNIRAKNFAMVSPVIGGTIEEIFVREGDTVKAGETVLFTVDSANLRRALDVDIHQHIPAFNITYEFYLFIFFQHRVGGLCQ